MKNKKNTKIILITIAVLILLLSIVAVSYAIFSPNFKIGSRHNTVGKSNPVSITYEDCADDVTDIDCSNISAELIPSESVTKTFKVTASGGGESTTGTYAYNLYFSKYFNKFTDSAGTGSDLKYKIEEIDENGDVLSTLVSQTDVPYSVNYTYDYKLNGDSPISINLHETQRYKLTITFAETNLDQSYNRNASFDITLSIREETDIIETSHETVNPPKLVTNLIPVIYDEGLEEWVSIDEDDIGWYNYEEQQWANAVTVNPDTETRAKYANVVPGTTIEMADISGMYVWIPRYEYKIAGTYQGEIQVKFVDTTVTSENVDTGYILHPAFMNGSISHTINKTEYPAWALGGWSEELTGFWYGKFEASGTSANVKVIPATSSLVVSSLRNMNTYNQFTAARGVSTYQGISNLDSHMSKNDEWGAVAYLSQSSYGKYGNALYTGANKEVYINNYFGYYTGVSSGAPSTAQRSTITCYYNDIQDRESGLGSCGGGASTTGNIYGVYDMNGGAWEYTMSYLSGYLGSSGWNSSTFNLEHKYYNAYTAASASTACNNGVCYGHALSETAGWYGDSQSMIYASYPWFVRGGGCNTGASAGVFYFYGSDYAGGAYGGSGFRVVLT